MSRLEGHWLGRLMAGLLLTLLKGYKLFLASLFAGSCRYVPSCSEYAADAVRLHGPLKGSWLAVRRLARCHPLSAAGLDPVPIPGQDPAGTTPPSA